MARGERSPWRGNARRKPSISEWGDTAAVIPAAGQVEDAPLSRHLLSPLRRNGEEWRFLLAALSARGSKPSARKPASGRPSGNVRREPNISTTAGHEAEAAGETSAENEEPARASYFQAKARQVRRSIAKSKIAQMSRPSPSRHGPRTRRDEWRFRFRFRGARATRYSRGARPP